MKLSRLDIYYVYAHRKDSGEVFYIGKGKGRRAWDRYGRNAMWRNVVDKHGITVEIVKSNLDEKSAFDLEIKLIKEYGRRNLNQGTLVNLTDGGEGPAGCITEKTVKAKLELLRYAKDNIKPPKISTEIGKMYFRYVRIITHPAYDDVLSEQVYRLRPDWVKRIKRPKVRPNEVSFSLLKSFIERHGFRPRQLSLDEDEKRLAKFCYNNIKDEVVSSYLEPIPTYASFIDTLNTNRLREYVKTYGHLPNRYDKDLKVKKLREFYNSKTTPNGSSFNLGFAEEFKNVLTPTEFQKRRRQEFKKLKNNEDVE